jgi:3-oxoacyl-ACP reductase-like protein
VRRWGGRRRQADAGASAAAPPPSKVERLRNPSAADAAAETADDVVSHADDVVQQLTAAKLALSLGQVEAATAAVDEALRLARRVLTDLATEISPTPMSPLVRAHASGRGSGPVPVDMPKPRSTRREA